MILIGWFDPVSFIVGVVSSSVLCTIFVRNALGRKGALEKALAVEKALVEHKDAEMVEYMVEYVFEREKLEELTLAVQYKAGQLEESLAACEAKEQEVHEQECLLLLMEEELAEKEEMIDCRLKRKDEELKGARARAKRLALKNNSD